MNHFISFADSRMTDSLNRLCRQAEALEFFDETTSFTEHDLLPEFTSRMGKYLTPSCKGFGYWSWKPWIISHALQKMKDGDRLLYLDAGCHINPRHETLPGICGHSGPGQQWHAGILQWTA